MTFVIQKNGSAVLAFRLGAGSQTEKYLTETGKIVNHGDGIYELFFQENHSSTGHKAHEGDYFTVDTAGDPHPYAKNLFEKNHRPISDSDFLYEQLPYQHMEAWNAGDPLNELVNFLIQNRSLTLHYEKRDQFFHHMGVDRYYDDMATLIFYDVTRDPNTDKIVNLNFKIVTKEELTRLYTVL